MVRSRPQRRVCQQLLQRGRQRLHVSFGHHQAGLTVLYQPTGRRANGICRYSRHTLIHRLVNHQPPGFLEKKGIEDLGK